MRKDIIVDINSGSFLPHNINENKKLFDVKIVDEYEEGMLDKNIYLETIIQDIYINESPEFLYIPYTPIDKMGYIRIGSVNNLGFTNYLNNPLTNNKWFKVCVNNEHVPISSLPIVNQDGRYSAMFDNDTGNINLYSMDEFDFKVSGSIYQDAQLLMKNYVGSNSRHPLSGIGIQQYLNSPVIERQLNQLILNELNSDGIIPNEVVLNNGVVTLDLKDDNESLGYEEEQQIR